MPDYDKSNLDIASGGQTFTFAKLREKYGNFYAPAYRILADDTDISTMNMMISSLTVSHSVSRACSCSLAIVTDPAGQSGQTGQAGQAPEQAFCPGTSVEVYVGYGNELEAIFTGVVTRVGFAFTSSGPPELTVDCTDFTHLMMRGSEHDVWSDKDYTSFSKVVAKILDKYLDKKRLSKKVVEDVEIEKKLPIVQSGQSDYNFIKGIANQNHIDFFVSGPNVYFQKRRTSDTPVAILAWGESLSSFRCDVDTASLVSGVMIKGWDAKKKEKFKVEVNIDGVKDRVGGKNMFEYVKKAYEDKTRLSYYTGIKETELAKKHAGDTLIKRNKEFFKASGDCVGIPQIIAGRIITIKGVGKLLDGDYYISEARQKLDNSGYRTSFTLTDC